MAETLNTKRRFPGSRYLLIGLVPIMLAGCASQHGQTWFDRWGKCALGGGLAGAAAGATHSGSSAAAGGGIGLLLGGAICALTNKPPAPPAPAPAPEPEVTVIEEVVEVPPPPPVKEEAHPLPPERLDSLYFQFDSTKIEKNSEQVLENAAKTLERFPHIHLKVNGYTDSTGPASYNDKLSVRRAQSVKQYLVEKKGISASRIQASGLGELQVNNATREGRAHNRRVDLELFAPEPPKPPQPSDQYQGQ
ncbi:OmpA family protein [Endozoicomonadaceae bacterium StTr2]